jgi:hypothetical protein
MLELGALPASRRRACTNVTVGVGARVDQLTTSFVLPVHVRSPSTMRIEPGRLLEDLRRDGLVALAEQLGALPSIDVRRRIVFGDDRRTPGIIGERAPPRAIASAPADHTEHADALDPAERRIEVVVVEQREGPGTNPTDIVSVWCGASAPADAVMTTPPSGLVWEVIEAQASDAAWPP